MPWLPWISGSCATGPFSPQRDEARFRSIDLYLRFAESNPLDSQVTIQDDSSYPGVASKPAPAEVVNLSGRLLRGGVRAGRRGNLVRWAAKCPSGSSPRKCWQPSCRCFLLGSFKYQIHKNALTYGMLLVIIATFCKLSTSEWHVEIRESGWWHWAHANLLTFHGLDDLIHADTMLFILGLTFFVSVIAQTRLLEGITFSLLRRNQGAILPTVISVTAFVAVASAVFGGVSMIGLTIRTLVIVLLLAAAPGFRHHLCGDRLHRDYHDLRRVGRLWRAAEPHHEGKPISFAGKRLLRHLLRPRGDRQLPLDCPPASQEASQLSTCTSTCWMSSKRTRKMCASCKRRATARFSRRSSLSRITRRNWARAPRAS